MHYFEKGSRVQEFTVHGNMVHPHACGELNREIVARKHGATIGCPITTGIFVGITARAAEEAAAEGKKNITPYWRVIKPDGSLNEKFPGGVNAQAAHLREEGHTIEPAKAKKPPKVKDFEKALVEV
ncbi:MAG: hypothetical protein DDT33_00346 [Firmicutes bacterium]|nr:hypothetical protein [Bacillota bacterium]